MVYVDDADIIRVATSCGVLTFIVANEILLKFINFAKHGFNKDFVAHDIVQLSILQFTVQLITMPNKLQHPRDFHITRMSTHYNSITKKRIVNFFC